MCMYPRSSTQKTREQAPLHVFSPDGQDGESGGLTLAAEGEVRAGERGRAKETASEREGGERERLREREGKRWRERQGRGERERWTGRGSGSEG